MHLSGQYRIVKTGGQTFALFASAESEGGFRAFVINETGERLLSLLEQERGLDELLAALEEEYSVQNASLRQDVESYLSRLKALGILATGSDA